MCLQAAGLTGKDDAIGFPLVLIEFSQDLIDQDCFSSARHTDREGVDAAVDTVLQNIFGSGGVSGGDDQGVVAGVSWGLPDDAVDLLLPAVPLVLLMVNVVVEHSVVSGEH